MVEPVGTLAAARRRCIGRIAACADPVISAEFALSNRERSMSDHILVDRDGPVLTVTLNRPEKFNALTFEMYGRLRELCASMPSDGPVKAMIIAGAGGRAFAAGTDISLFRDFRTEADGLKYERDNEATLSALEACPVPIIAAIAGACTGGGAGIAACCDLRIGTRDMKYGFPIARTLGNMLASATLDRLASLLGEARLIELLYTARLIEAEEAHRIGLVSELCDGYDALMRRARELAQQIASHAPLTLRATKQLLFRMREARRHIPDEDLVAKVYTSADFREGLDAFLTKRKPAWTGR
jgi:enoyl-CoA hydratase/carnithine racemase